MCYELTICIPTFSRGRRALENVKNILENIHDNWCIVVLDNASTIEAEYYEEINRLSKDIEQLIYVKHESNIQFFGNFLECIKYPSSKYVLIISDEDFVNLNELESILEDLRNHKNLGACRTSISPHKDLKEPGNSYIYPEEYFKAGKDALLGFSFVGNYISGIMYNLENIKKTNILDILNKNIKSHKEYPHLYFDLLVSASFDVLITSKVSILEGSPDKHYDEVGADVSLIATQLGPYSYGGRINQFLTFRNGILDALSLMTFDNREEEVNLFVNLYAKLVHKYYFLIFQANVSNYIGNHMEISSLKESFFYLTCSSVLQHSIVNNYQESVMNHLITIYQKHKN